MIKILILLIVATSINAKKWEIKRNPFTVSEVYIKQTKKGYLEPKNNYIPFEIKLIGIVHTPKTKEAILDIEFTGITQIALNERRKIDTPDIESWLKVTHVAQHYVTISLNGGEGIRYEIK